MREPEEEFVTKRESRRRVFRWIRVHHVYVLPNGHRWRTKTLYRRRTSKDEPPVEVMYFCALHRHIELAPLLPPVDLSLPGTIRMPHPERPGRYVLLFCPECCGAGYRSIGFPMPQPEPPPSQLD